MQSRPATILYVAWAPFFSGAERALLVLIEHLDRTRYRPVVIVGTDGELAAELRTRQICIHHIPIVYKTARRMPSWLRSVAQFVRVARSEHASILHANDLPSFQPAGYTARFLRLPTLCHLRFPDSRAGFEWFLKPGFSQALFISESLKAQALAEAPKTFKNKSRVVYDGVMVPSPIDQRTRQRLRNELALGADRTAVVLAGQVAEIKGLWDYIEAAKLVLARNRPVTFVIIGDDLKNNGALRVEAEQAVLRQGLSDHVRFLGFRHDVPRLMPAFDIVTMPSHVEPLGLAALEGMAAARPVVASRVGGLAETVVNDVTGLLVPPRDPPRLAAAIEQLALNPVQAEAFGRAGRQRVIAQFSIDAHVLAMQAIYDQVLSATAPAK
jgi:glycosyltransferase involved in cell wall biosynthesis